MNSKRKLEKCGLNSDKINTIPKLSIAGKRKSKINQFEYSFGIELFIKKNTLASIIITFDMHHTIAKPCNPIFSPK